MSDEKKNSLDQVVEDVHEDEQLPSALSFQNIYAMVVLNWQWFLLSLIIFISGALIYLRYTTPVYQVNAKVLMKEDNSGRRRSVGQMLSNIAESGTFSNSIGIENEMEVIKTQTLAREAVRRLKLYTEYHTDGRVKEVLMYKSQPVTIDLDEKHLNWFDTELSHAYHAISLTVIKKDGVYHVDGNILLNGQPHRSISKQFKSLPASFETSVGTLTFTANSLTEPKDDFKFYVTIRPPMSVALSYVSALQVAPMGAGTSIALLSMTNTNALRGMDYLSELVRCYNDQANADKNEIALKTEEFINKRIEKIDKELGATESSIENYKRRNAMVSYEAAAGQSQSLSSNFEQRLAESNSQLQLLDYLREYVDNPSNTYKIIPSNVGLTDGASTGLISNYNQVVQNRNRLLKSASEQAPQVQTLTSTLDELQGSIRTALLQARRSADIHRQGVQNQYAKYQGRVSMAPEQERILNQIGRQQGVKTDLYLLLLQKREENSISLAATADKGQLLDNPKNGGKVSPKDNVILTTAIILALAIPFAILMLLQFMRYRIEGHDDVARLTRLPIVADIPVASDAVKGKAGIVVQENKNNQIDEVFRGLRTNIQFMMKESDRIILFTSSTSGEGKTFLAANLAASFAFLGKRVVLCGLDIRKPALGRLFELSDRHQGITNLLTKDTVSEADVRAQLCPSGFNENLDLLLAGPTPPNPTELLARENLRQVMDVLRKDYDYVILDTAPVGLVTDTLEIARHADVNCYVCRADYTPKSNIGLLNTLANDGKLLNTCVVLNGVDMSKRKYGYYYGYGRYGRYGRYGYGRYGYGRYGYGRYGYSNYGNYGNYGNYAESHYGNKEDNSIKK